MQTDWDRRYERFGAQLRTAMCQGLPDVLNSYLHEWQLEQLGGIFAPRKSRRLLDAGCGYGRLALPLALKQEGTSLLGLDSSIQSIELFNQRMPGKGWGCVGDITCLPFADASFDGAIMVTALMYIHDPLLQRAAVRELARVTRADGKIAIIENNRRGGWLFRLLGFMRAQFSGTKTIETGGESFRPGQMDALLKDAGADVVYKSGCPVFTLGLPLWLGLALMNSRQAASVLRVCRTLDRRMARFSTLSLYICYEISKKQMAEAA